MRRTIFIFAWVLSAAIAVRAVAAPQAPPQGRVVDRIVARIEDDIILQSQMRELGAFQELVDGHRESDNKLLSELVEQWMVQTESSTVHFPAPAKSEVDRELARLKGQFASPQAYSAKLRELGLSADEVRQLLARQIYIERYIDYKFRPSVQIESADIQAYYQKVLLPELAKNKQPVPRLADVQEKIRELLTQRKISDLTAKWLDDTKSRLKIEVALPAARP
ncbi:MAG TPA: hypothetical protein VNI36_08615 [Candidatus Dormibacteraeota bacterium]|nr:hypothetical protein [Candidatus Dormibacteraeota bacterium]